MKCIILKYFVITLCVVISFTVTVWFTPEFLSHAGVRDNPQLALAEGDIYLKQDFKLVDQYGKPFNRARLNGNWSLLFFGYTSCPDICPNTLLVLNQVYARLKDNKKLQYIFVSVDPQRDTPNVLKDYMDHYNPDFIGITGEMEQIKILTSQLDIKHHIETKNDIKNSTNYVVVHSASITMIDPKGRWRAVMFSPHKTNKIATTVQEVMAHFGDN